MLTIATEVRKRWGKRGCWSSDRKRPNGRRSFRVGYMECGFFTIVGEGESWAEAIAEADTKAEGKED